MFCLVFKVHFIARKRLSYINILLYSLSTTL